MKTALWVVLVVLAIGGSAFALTRAAAPAGPAQPEIAVPAGDFQADDCCRVTVTGCDKRANVCVPGRCNLDNERLARDAFEKQYSCNSSGVSSYIGTCSGEKCDIDLRK